MLALWSPGSLHFESQLSPTLLFGVFAAACITGCAARASAPEPTSPLATHDIVVREFDTTGAEVYRMENDDIRPLGVGLAKAIAGIFEWWDEENWHEGKTRYDPNAEPGPGRILIEGRITYIDGGSRAMRYFIGWGAGNVQVWAKGRVVGADGAVLADFVSEQSCSRAMAGGDYETLLQDCLDAIAYEVGEIVMAEGFNTHDGTGAKWNPDEFAPVHGPLNMSGESPPSVAEAPSVEDRLKRLDRLRKQGTISDEEYEAQRKRILEDL